jgi:hypothetical protein
MTCTIRHEVARTVLSAVAYYMAAVELGNTAYRPSITVCEAPAPSMTLYTADMTI